MKRFNCLVALGANQGTINPHHEVPKRGISRAEVIILRSMHGKDSVFNIVPVPGEYEFVETTEENINGKNVIQERLIRAADDMQIYRHLAETYPTKLIESLFNVKLTDLADGLDDLTEGLDDVQAVQGKRTLPAPGAVDDAPDLEIPPPGSHTERRPALA